MQQHGWNDFAASLEDDLDEALAAGKKKNSTAQSKSFDAMSDEDDLDFSDDKDQIAPQEYEYLCVLDFEACRQWAGKDPDDDEWIVEITEFPVLLLNIQTLKVEEEFHKYVRPTLIDENLLNIYVQGKYGERFGLKQDWTSTAQPLPVVLGELHEWLVKKQFVSQDGSPLKKFIFLTCGDWDLRNALPRNLDRLGLPVPSYMQEWINIKPAFGAFYKCRRNPAGMTDMLKQLGLKLDGHHHLGIDDCRNISRIAVTMLKDGWVAAATNNTKGQTTEERNAINERKKKEKRAQGKGYLAKRKKNGVCSYWLRGACDRGDACRFLHEQSN